MRTEFVVSLFGYEETNGFYPFANRLNGLYDLAIYIFANRETFICGKYLFAHLVSKKNTQSDMCKYLTVFSSVYEFFIFYVEKKEKYTLKTLRSDGKGARG
jgi:hypothetical protein